MEIMSTCIPGRDSVTVRFVDFGNIASKKLDEVYHVTDDQPDDVRRTRALALPCQLDNVEPIESAEWTDAAIHEFQKAFPEVTRVTVEFKSWRDGVHLVDVFVDGRSLADSLIATKVAKASVPATVSVSCNPTRSRLKRTYFDNNVNNLYTVNIFFIPLTVHIFVSNLSIVISIVEVRTHLHGLGERKHLISYALTTHNFYCWR